MERLQHGTVSGAQQCLAFRSMSCGSSRAYSASLFEHVFVCVCTGQQELHRARLKSRCHEVVVLQWSRPRACAVALTHGWRPLHVQRMPTVNVCWKPRLASSCSPPPLRASVSVFLLASQPSCLRPVPAPHCRAMMSVLAYLASALLVGGGCASGEAVIAFDGAAASSTYAGGDFAATEATSKGSGYWCRCVASMHVHGCIRWHEEALLCAQFGEPCSRAERDLDGYVGSAAEGRWSHIELVRVCVHSMWRRSGVAIASPPSVVEAASLLLQGLWSGRV